jgi:hypothetical protein
MRADVPMLVAAIKAKQLTIETAKKFLTFPLFVIPVAQLNVDTETEGVILPYTGDDPWTKFAHGENAMDGDIENVEHPLEEYAILTRFDAEAPTLAFTAIQVFSAQRYTSTAMLYYEDIKVLKVVTVEMIDGKPADGNKEVTLHYASSYMLKMWLDYTRSIRLTPVLKGVKEVPVGKKAGDNLKLKSAPHASIIFLDRLPTRSESVKDVERLCTESTTKRGHQRIAYRKTLTADRYRNHPKYMVKDGVRVRTTWVGERTSSDLEGNTYTVMELK